MNRIRTLLAFLLLVGLAVPAAAQLSLGDSMPMADRAMLNVDNSNVTTASVKGANGTVVVFWCNTCPWVKKYEDRVLDLANTYQAQGFGFIAVNANDMIAYPGDNFDEMQKAAARKAYPFPYVVDEGSDLAEAYGATRTPHVYVFDANNVLQYVGAPDDSPSDPGKVETPYLAQALDAIAAGSSIPNAETKAFGCTIKFQE
ncbi:MAG: thioredoxin family protein [Bacteroidota bacterium]